MKRILEKKHELFSFLVAGIAVLLSQLQPFYTYVGSPEFEVRHIDHMDVRLVSAVLSPFPVPDYLIFNTELTVTNVGSDLGNIRNIFIVITDETDNVVLTSKNAEYLADVKGGGFTQSIWRPLSGTALSVDEVWAAPIRFKFEFPQNTLWNLSELKSSLIREIADWEYYSEDPEWLEEKIPDVFSVSQELKQDIDLEMNKVFPWIKEGKYQLYFVIDADHQQSVSHYAFKIPSDYSLNLLGAFTVFELSDSTMAVKTQKGHDLNKCVIQLEQNKKLPPKHVMEKIS